MRIIHLAKVDAKKRRLSHQTLRIQAVTSRSNQRLFGKYGKGVIMRKSTIFISSVLTTFALVVLYGLVSAYRNISTTPEVSALTVDTATPEPTDTAVPTTAPTATPSTVTPQQAAQLAAQVVGNNNLLSAESSSINGTDAYKITFTNNDVVFVSLDGQILSVQVAPAIVNVEVPVQVQAQTQHKNKNNKNNGGTSSGGGESQEPGDD
jgi:hypothetical protein